MEKYPSETVVIENGLFALNWSIRIGTLLKFLQVDFQDNKMDFYNADVLQMAKKCLQKFPKNESVQIWGKYIVKCMEEYIAAMENRNFKLEHSEDVLVVDLHD